MGMPRGVGIVSTVSGKPIPVWTGPAANLLTASTFSILNGIATIVVANTYVPGNQVGLYGFATATYFNGVPVTVLDATALQFRFYHSNANVNSTADTGKCFIEPPTYRVVRLELAATAGAGIVYVGDGMVSATKYVAALTLAAQPSIEIDGNAIPAGRVHVNGSASETGVVVSLLY